LANLKNFNCFVHVDIQGKPFEARCVRDFTAELKGEKMLYGFFVPCHVRETPRFNEIHIAVYDPEFHCSIFLIEDLWPTRTANPTRAPTASRTIRTGLIASVRSSPGRSE